LCADRSPSRNIILVSSLSPQSASNLLIEHFQICSCAVDSLVLVSSRFMFADSLADET